MVALKRAGLVSTFRTVYSARLQENAGLLEVVELMYDWRDALLGGKERSRVYCSKRRDQTVSFQSHHSFKRVFFTYGCTGKFPLNIYIYSFSYSLHHAKLQTPFNKTFMNILQSLETTDDP